jgi:flagellar assembly protein FliH
LTELIARPYDFAQVGELGEPREFRPAFELRAASGVPEALVESAREEARASGYAAGWAQGMQDARAQMAADVETSRRQAAALDAQRRADRDRAVAALATAADALETRSVPTLEQLEDVVVTMAVRIAETLVGHELAVATRPGLSALARVLALVPADEDVSVQLAPADVAELAGSEEFTELVGARAVTLVAAPGLRPGDAVARSGATEIDARIAPALERVKEFLQR